MGGDDVRKIAKDNFEDAHAHLDQDLADTRTALEAGAVRTNHDDALARYMDAIRAALQCTSADWEATLADAQRAQADVTEARAAGEKFDKRLAKMTAFTGKIADLIEKATG